MTAHLDDRFLFAIHDPRGLGVQDLRVRFSQQFLRVTLGDLLNRRSATTRQQPGAAASTKRPSTRCIRSLYAAAAANVTRRAAQWRANHVVRGKASVPEPK
jgi:hypothetical protein